MSAIDPGHSLELWPDDAQVLGLDGRVSATAREMLCLAILGVPENSPLTAHLLASAVVNLAMRIAVQAVRSDGEVTAAS